MRERLPSYVEDNFLVKQQVKRRRKKKGNPLHSLAVRKDCLKRGPVKESYIVTRDHGGKDSPGTGSRKNAVV